MLCPSIDGQTERRTHGDLSLTNEEFPTIIDLVIEKAEIIPLSKSLKVVF
jgi:hypothetical protein